MKKISFNLIFSAFILIGMLTSVILLNVVGASASSEPWIQAVISIGVIAGAVNIVLSANGSIWNYLFGLIDVLSTVIVSLVASLHNDNPIWGQFALHAAYFLPMQFIGFFQWRRRGATSKENVRPRRLSAKGWGITGASFVVVAIAMFFLLNVIGNPDWKTLNAVILMDTVLTTLCIIGQVMMSMAYAEQWYIWIAVNVSAIVLYWLKSSGSEADSYMLIYMVKYIFYFINSLNGLRIWLKFCR